VRGLAERDGVHSEGPQSGALVAPVGRRPPFVGEGSGASHPPPGRHLRAGDRLAVLVDRLEAEAAACAVTHHQAHGSRAPTRHVHGCAGHRVPGPRPELQWDVAARRFAGCEADTEGAIGPTPRGVGKRRPRVVDQRSRHRVALRIDDDAGHRLRARDAEVGHRAELGGDVGAHSIGRAVACVVAVGAGSDEDHQGPGKHAEAVGAVPACGRRGELAHTGPGGAPHGHARQGLAGPGVQHAPGHRQRRL